MHACKMHRISHKHMHMYVHVCVRAYACTHIDLHVDVPACERDLLLQAPGLGKTAMLAEFTRFCNYPGSLAEVNTAGGSPSSFDLEFPLFGA